MRIGCARYTPGIYMDDISIDCHIGPADDERAIEQRIIVGLYLDIDLFQAGREDNIECTVDYRAVVERLVELAGTSAFRTLEGLGFEIAKQTLRQFMRLRGVTVIVCKPGVPGRAGSTQVVINLTREQLDVASH